MPEQRPADFIVLGLDVIRYSEKNLLGQKLAQEKVDRYLNEALASKWTGSRPYWIDAGDGGYALFQGAELDVLDVLQEFYVRLDRENKPLMEERDKVYVRSAIHKDQVVVWDTLNGDKKYTGKAINNCARLMAGMIKDHERQVICSRPVLDAMMSLDEAVSPTRLKDIEDKHGHLHEVWNIRRHGLGVKPVASELYPEAALRIYEANRQEV